MLGTEEIGRPVGAYISFPKFVGAVAVIADKLVQCEVQRIWRQRKPCVRHAIGRRCDDMLY